MTKNIFSIDEFGLNGHPVAMHDGVCSVFGKLFHAPKPLPKNIALQLAANEALNHFGVDRHVQRMELRKHIRLNRFDFCKIAGCISRAKPSRRKGWVVAKWCAINDHKSNAKADDALKCGVIQLNWPYVNLLDYYLLGYWMIVVPPKHSL